MVARRREEVIARLGPGIAIKKVMITMLFTARQLIALDALPKGQNRAKNISFRTYFCLS
jgi:hypothetical protein